MTDARYDRAGSRERPSQCLRGLKSGKGEKPAENWQSLLCVAAQNFRPDYSKAALKCTHHYHSDVCTCNLYRCVYVTHNTYTHQTPLLMFIYIQIINLCYRYVSFYAIAIKYLPNMISFVMLAYDRRCHMAKQCHCPRLIIVHRVALETLVHS